MCVYRCRFCGLGAAEGEHQQLYRWWWQDLLLLHGTEPGADCLPKPDQSVKGCPNLQGQRLATSLNTINHNHVSAFTGFEELAVLLWLQGREKKGLNEGEQLHKWCIIQCFTSPVSLGCCSLWIISVLYSFGFFFTCHCCEANCKSIKLRLQWHSPTLLPSHPLPPLLVLFPPHLISLAITIPSLDGNWQKLFLEVSPAVYFSCACHYALITSTVLRCAELLN